LLGVTLWCKTLVLRKDKVTHCILIYNRQWQLKSTKYSEIRFIIDIETIKTEQLALE